MSNRRSDLDFLLETLRKLHLQAAVLPAAQLPEQPLDFGLRAFLGRHTEYRELFSRAGGHLRPNTICKLTDIFRCVYIFLQLPGSGHADVLVAGPYIAQAVEKQELIEVAEQLSLSPRVLRQMEKYYEGVPVIPDDRFLFALFTAFGERLWGSADAFEIVDADQEVSSAELALPPDVAPDSPEEMLMNMQVMETRYAYENELMRIVSQGLIHRADKMLSGFSQLTFEERTGDPLRNLKNYSIICNTLLRKAAEQGGVHPVYLDTLSSEFARRIENLRSVAAGQALMGEMIRAYCRLVKKNATRRYSAVVQRTIACIDSDPAADLRLQTLARLQNVNASYLSSLFRKETGETITEHTLRKRMEYAAHLLRTSRLQVQTVAQHCGIPDPNYFSKLFKKHHGMTPVEFREQGVRTEK